MRCTKYIGASRKVENIIESWTKYLTLLICLSLSLPQFGEYLRNEGRKVLDHMYNILMTYGCVRLQYARELYYNASIDFRRAFGG